MPSAQSYGRKRLSSIQDGTYDTLARGSQVAQAKHSPGQVTKRKLSDAECTHNSNTKSNADHAVSKIVQSLKDLKQA